MSSLFFLFFLLCLVHWPTNTSSVAILFKVEIIIQDGGVVFIFNIVLCNIPECVTDLTQFKEH